MWPFRKRPKPRGRTFAEQRAAELAVVRAKNDERDKVLTEVFGLNVEKVESCWDWFDRGVALKVHYRSGYVGDVLIGDPRLQEVARLL
jgi:hypothetical protein